MYINLKFIHRPFLYHHQSLILILFVAQASGAGEITDPVPSNARQAEAEADRPLGNWVCAELNEEGEPKVKGISNQDQVQTSSSSRLSTRQALKNPAKRWKNGKIPYVFATNYPQKYRENILRGISFWNTQLKNCLEIVPREKEMDFVQIVNGNGCYSEFGRRNGVEKLSLQVRACTETGTVIHEFLHSAGLIHEQNRHDRDEHITVHWPNIKPAWRKQFEKTSSQNFDTYFKYDCSSVMHYSRYGVFTVRGRPAFTAKNGTFCNFAKVGRRQNFSPQDIANIKKMYKC